MIVCRFEGILRFVSLFVNGTAQPLGPPWLYVLNLAESRSMFLVMTALAATPLLCSFDLSPTGRLASAHAESQQE